MIIKLPKNQLVSNLRVYDLEESILASQYPMLTETHNFMEDVDDDVFYKALKTANKLGSTKTGEAHDQFLTGINVSFDLTFTNKAWVELERYRFIFFTSSTSTMHRISRFDFDKQYNEYVDPRIIEIMKELKNKYNETKDKEDYLKLLYSNPAGFKVTARLTTNYRALKTAILQRHNHRLPEWREFCKLMVDNLPQFKELTGVRIDE